MRNDTTKSAQLNRRRFLTGASLALGAAGASAAASATAAPPAEAGEVEQQSGYRETEHVKTYYETAR